ncbi:MAG: hypothetical protein COS84_09525, partial [Armatimonadetes bacterium CG07_land_8_20_14_0_80_40_9]
MEGSAFLNLHFSKFKLYGDDLLQIINNSTGATIVIYDRNSFPQTGGWTGKLGWGVDKLKIRFIYTPTADSVNCNPSWIIDKYMRSHRCYASSVMDDNQWRYGAWRATDDEEGTYWKAEGNETAGSP